MNHLDTAALQEGLPHIAASPSDDGTLEMIVRRPTVDGREVVARARIEPGLGLEGDSWGRARTPHPTPRSPS